MNYKNQTTSNPKQMSTKQTCIPDDKIKRIKCSSVQKKNKPTELY